MREHRWSSIDGECYDCGQPRAISQGESRNDECRATFPETWMGTARLIAEHSCNPRLKVGAIIVTSDNTSILSVGYNGTYKGAPSNYPESLEPGKSDMIHAELNACIKVDFNHHKEKHLYVTHSPCAACAGIVINAGIKRVVYGTKYRDLMGVEILKSANIEVLTIEEAIYNVLNT